jgi:hypothetical protein
MATDKKTGKFKDVPVATTKPDYLTQKQWEFLKSGKEHHSEKTERAKKIVANMKWLDDKTPSAR